MQSIAVAVGVGLLFSKFAAYLFTHSNIVLTDAFESIINVAAGGFAVYSIHISSKPRDYDHPYGHGKVEFISAGFEGILILIAGAMIIVESVIGLIKPHSLEHLDTGMVVIVLSGLINLMLGLTLQKAGDKHGSLILKADGQHLKTDAFSSFAALIGLLFIKLTGLIYFDNIIAIVFGIAIIYTGTRLIRKSIGGIMDEADEGVISPIVEKLNNHRAVNWIDVHNLRVIQFGAGLHIDCHVTLPWYFTLEQAHIELDKMQAVINDGGVTPIEFFIHEDPCVPECCKICMIGDCKVRTEAFKKKIEWNMENVRKNEKHGVGGI